jgi:CheY-like chemotaxis protein
MSTPVVADSGLNVSTEDPAVSSAPTASSTKNGNWDWVLSNCDNESAEPQSVNDELHRLKVLMSYMILDSDSEEAFDRLTRMAARIFGVPIALISLVDLGRNWFMSNYGLGDVLQIPREGSFCARAIHGKSDVFEVPDATQDPRFCDSPLVLDEPQIRFYAGAPLLSPEGYKLGTFCIIDRQPRPNGLSEKQKSLLKSFAAITIKTMADRRHLADQEDPSRLVACTAHDLLTPLSGVLLSLSMLKDDEEFDKTLNEHQKECIATASRSSEMMRRICQTTIETLRKASKGVVVNGSNSRPETNNDGEARPFIDIREFVKSLHMIIDPIPKRVPLVITVDASVPMHIASDDLKIFRSSLNLLSNACRNTETGSIRFRMYVKDNQLVFECEDSGQDIDLEDRDRLFHPHMDDFGAVADLGLYSLAAQIDSLGGQYGFRPRGEGVDGAVIKDNRGRKVTGSVFWFSIPMVVPSEMPRPSSSDGITHLSGIRSVESFASAGASGSSIDTTGISRNNSGLLAVTAAAARSLSMSGSSNNCLDCLVRTLSAQSSAAFGQRKQPLRGTVNSTWEKKGSKPTNINIMRIRKALGGDNSTVRRNAHSTGSLSSASFGSAAKLSSASLAGLAQQVESAQKNAASRAAASNPDGPRIKKALVIEDSVVVRKTLARALQKLGYDVSQAVDGMEGLKELKQTVYDLSLCDFLMPNMDGLDCVQQYRKWEEENRPSFRQYIVGISAHAGHKDIEKGLEIGMNHFYAKPVRRGCSLRLLMNISIAVFLVASFLQVAHCEFSLILLSPLNYPPSAGNNQDSDPATRKHRAGASQSHTR